MFDDTTIRQELAATLAGKLKAMQALDQFILDCLSDPAWQQRQDARSLAELRVSMRRSIATLKRNRAGGRRD